MEQIKIINTFDTYQQSSEEERKLELQITIVSYHNLLNTKFIVYRPYPLATQNALRSKGKLQVVLHFSILNIQ